MTLSKGKAGKFIWITLLTLSVAAAVMKIFVGFDIDEGYAVSMPYRLLQGDHLFLDMWEVHQTSSFLPILFLGIFEKITGGANGSVLYLRVVATLIHALISWIVFLYLKRKTHTEWAILLALLYFNMLPKWLISLDFSLQQVWGMTFILLLLVKETETGKSRYAFWMGILLAATVLAYPGMVLGYPALMVSLCALHKSDKIKSKFNKCVFLTLGCAVMAVSFFAYVLSEMNVKTLIESIPLVFMDGTHQFTMQTKLLAYATQWLNVGKQLLILITPSIIMSVIYCLTVYRMQSRRLKENRKENSMREKTALVFLFSYVIITSLLILLANAAGIQIGPFHFQVRYLLFFFFMFVWSLMRKKENTFLFWGPMFQMAVAFIAILIFSNVGPDSSSSYLSIGLLAGFAIIDMVTNRMDKEKEDGAADRKKLGWNTCAWLVLALFVLSLVFCKGYYVRITEYGPANILQAREQISEGPLEGIYVLPDDYDRMTSDYETIRSATEGKEKLLYLGTEGISNLYAQCSFVSPSTISTPAFNEQWVLYFEMYPEKEPDVIALAKNTIDNREKFFDKNPLGMWIAERYDVGGMQETESLCIIYKK